MRGGEDRMSRRLATCAVLLLVGAGRTASADGPPAAASPLARLVEDRAPAVVSIKYVYRGSGRDYLRTGQGTVVDPTGIVLLSNSYFSWTAGTVVDLKVMFGTEAKE